MVYDHAADAGPVTVLGIAGSFRHGSLNRLLLRCAEALAPDGVVFDPYGDLEAVPHFSEDLEGDRTPASVRDLRARIDRADAVLFATPEYNSSMPGVLKNALDWASRPTGESVLVDKPAAVVGASPGRFGAQRAQADVRKVLTAIGAGVLDKELPVARAHEVLDVPAKVLDVSHYCFRPGRDSPIVRLLSISCTCRLRWPRFWRRSFWSRRRKALCEPPPSNGSSCCIRSCRICSPSSPLPCS